MFSVLQALCLLVLTSVWSKIDRIDDRVNLSLTKIAVLESRLAAIEHGPTQ